MSNQESIPRHVGIIMDGNGRWAQNRNHSRIYGHVRGASKVKPIVKEADRLGVKALTLFTFSTENWSRPEQERQVLWKLLRSYLLKEVGELKRENVRLRVIGEIDRLDKDIQRLLTDSIEILSGNTGLILTFALSYGSRRELAMAAKNFASDCLDGKRNPDEMNESLLNQYLWTADLGTLSNVDLVIRTSGEMRISNFLLWQSAYAEYYFVDAHWPDFEPAHLRQAVEVYGKRERRFGNVMTARPRQQGLLA